MEKTEENNKFRIFTDNASGITLFLEIKDGRNLSFYFLQRTYDVVYNGDRTDVHVIISLMFAAFLRQFSNGISSSLFDIGHPVIEDEVWGRYIMPEQIPSFLGIISSEQLEDAIAKIICIVGIWRDFFWSFIGCMCKDCLRKNNINTQRGYELPENIVNSLNKVYKLTTHTNYGNRQRPNWSYFYDIGNEVTIIKSKELSAYFEYLQELNENKSNTIKGLNGELIIHGELRNFIENKEIKSFQKLVEYLFNNESKDYNLIPLENMIITVVNPYIIAFGRLSGVEEFKYEREILRKRHNKESELLFPIPLFEWEENACPNQFELLIKCLLEREPGVKTVRRPAPINQGDKGRDLIIEWYVRNSKIVSHIQPPTLLMRIVGQCKASKSTVGKGKVLDIRDTIETHDSEGFFLAVNTQISAPLTEKLESLRKKGFWTNWWNREDIEMRLSKNQDLLPKFPKVVRAKHQVKFIERD